MQHPLVVSMEAPAPTVASNASAASNALTGGRERRVLLLLEDLGGGTGNHVCRMVAEWVRLGWRVTLVTQTPPLVRALPPGVDVRVIETAGWYDRFPIAQVRRLLALRRLVRRLRPDIVHTYFFWSIVYGRLLRLVGDIGVLIENREDMGFSWGRGSYGVLGISRRVPDRIICVADAVRRVALEREGADPGRTTVVHNGVEQAGVRPSGDRELARRRLGFGPGDVVIGMVANLPRAVKGGRRLLDAVSAIVRAAPMARFVLVGLGTEPAVLGGDLEARGIAGHVVGVGYQREVESFYAAMDISVLTSSTEGLSITLLESMRHGLPTVVTRVGGNPEVVVDGVTGFLVDLDDSAAFVDRVVTLVRDRERRVAMGEAGRRRVADRFAIEGVAAQYLAVYADLLQAEREPT
jgi:glycosyltransferase involved in cell wall biosynthesis